MSLKEINIRGELKKINGMGYIKTMRSGDTGIGFTLETLLGLRETNTRNKQDFSYNNVPTELKTQRKSTSSMMTLFTLEPYKGGVNDRKLIELFGYLDRSGRDALKVTLTTTGFVPQGLGLDFTDDELCVIDRDSNRYWVWKRDNLAPKIDSLVIVFANTRGRGANEHFFYNNAYYLKNLDYQRFFNLFDRGYLVVDLRMHIKDSGSVRNHGTAFRIRGLDKLLNCYSHRENLL